EEAQYPERNLFNELEKRGSNHDHGQGRPGVGQEGALVGHDRAVDGQLIAQRGIFYRRSANALLGHCHIFPWLSAERALSPESASPCRRCPSGISGLSGVLKKGLTRK